MVIEVLVEVTAVFEALEVVLLTGCEAFDLIDPLEMVDLKPGEEGSATDDLDFAEVGEVGESGA